jgi:hypothetical protein
LNSCLEFALSLWWTRSPHVLHFCIVGSFFNCVIQQLDMFLELATNVLWKVVRIALLAICFLNTHVTTMHACTNTPIIFRIIVAADIDVMFRSRVINENVIYTFSVIMHDLLVETIYIQWGSIIWVQLLSHLVAFSVKMIYAIFLHLT